MSAASDFLLKKAVQKFPIIAGPLELVPFVRGLKTSVELGLLVGTFAGKHHGHGPEFYNPEIAKYEASALRPGVGGSMII